MAQLKPNSLSSWEEVSSGSEDERTSGSESDVNSDTDSDEKQTQEPKKAPIAPPKSTHRPGALDSSETEESDSDTDSDSPPKRSAVEKQTQEPKKAPIAPPKSTNRSGALVSSETEESDSDTDSDSPPKTSAVVDPNVKSRGNADIKLVKKDGSKTISTPPPAKSKRPPPAPTENERDAKKPKQNAANTEPKKGKKSTVTGDDSKKQLFQRLWSEDDEIVILEGIIAYKTEKNGDPVADMGAFHEFIKKSLHIDVSRSQLVDKVRRLKKKYVNHASKEIDGKHPSFLKPHEQKGYELSKLIWGSNSNSNINSHNSGTESKKKQSKKNENLKSKSNGVDDNQKSVMEVEKKIDVSRFVQYGGMNDSQILSEEIVKAGMELVDGSKRAELELKWKKLKEQELVLYVNRMELLREQALVVLEAMNSSGK